MPNSFRFFTGFSFYIKMTRGFLRSEVTGEFMVDDFFWE